MAKLAADAESGPDGSETLKMLFEYQSERRPGAHEEASRSIFSQAAQVSATAESTGASSSSGNEQ
jgi:hypothetical protein